MASPGKAVSDGRLPVRAAQGASATALTPRRAIERPLATAALAFALFSFVLALYLVCLHATAGGAVESPGDMNARDSLYFGIHGFFLVIAATTGFSLGKWVNGLGLAFAVLLLVATAVAMVATQVASYELACQGRNDLVRHWEC